jgi:hypothetical protein
MEETRMTTVTVYNFRKYDVASDHMQVSRRMATRQAILEILQGEVMEETAVEVDASVIQSDIPGMTVIGFSPSQLRAGGFQTQVR